MAPSRQQRVRRWNVRRTIANGSPWSVPDCSRRKSGRRRNGHDVTVVSSRAELATLALRLYGSNFASKLQCALGWRSAR